MTILSDMTGDLIGRSTEAAQYSLTLGETWEAWLAREITRLGLPAYRLDQRFIPADLLADHRRLKRCRLQDNPSTSPESRALLRPYQVDLAVKLGSVRRVLLEVKALTPVAFDQPVIHLGRVEKYDKRLQVSAVALINRGTREVWISPYDPAMWHRRRSLVDPGVMDYAVPRQNLSPLAAWLDFLRDTAR